MDVMTVRAGWWIALATAGCLSKPGAKAAPTDAPPDQASEGSPNLAFVTSLPVPISSYASRDALDATCTTLARNHGHSGTYVAWFSLPGSNALDRLSGFRGWVRLDGKPFADTLTDIANGKIYNPLSIDETSTDVGDSARVATATDPSGTYDSSSVNTGACFGQSNAPGTVQYGTADATKQTWTAVGDTAVGCTTPVRFYCFEIDHANPLVAPSETGRIAFLSALPTLGSVGQPALDKICQDDADTLAGQPHVVALIATGGQSLAQRLSPGLPWVRPDGVEVMPGDMSRIEAPINVTVEKSYETGAVWTGASNFTAVPDGTGIDNCNDWLNAGGSARSGGSTRSSFTSSFSGAAISVCGAAQYRLYCFQP